MRVFYIVMVFISAISCKSVQTTPKPVKEVVNSTTSALNEVDQRRFDYFFYEGLRERLAGNYQKAFTYFIDCLKIDANSGVTLYEMGKLLLMQENISEAEKFLGRAVLSNPENVSYLQLYADILIKSNKIPEAIGIYQNIVKLNVSNEESIYILAMLYKDNKMYEHALSSLNELEAKIGITDFISLEKEKLYLSLGKPKSALNELQILLDKYPDSPLYYSFIGDFYYRNSNYIKSEEFYSKAITLDEPNSFYNIPFSYVFLAKGDTTNFKLLFNRGLASSQTELETKLEQLFILLEKKQLMDSNPGLISTLFETLIQVHPDNWRLYGIMGQYYGNSDIKASVLYYRKAISLEQTNEELWHNALVALMTGNEMEDVVELGSKAIRNFPSNPFFRLLSGASLQQLKKCDAAVQMLQVADTLSLAYAPAFQLQVLSTLGDSYFCNGDTSLSFSTYERALVINANYLPVLNNYSYYLSLVNMDLDKAERMSMKCVEIEPGNSTYLDTYAWVLFQRKRFFEAKFIIERAMDNGGDQNSDILHHYGDILWFNNNLEEAVKQWERALNLSPDNQILEKKVEFREYFER